MTANQLEKTVGKLVLVKHPTTTKWYKAKLIYVFVVPDGIPERKRACLIKTRKKIQEIVLAENIYYSYPHYSKEIKEYQQTLLKNVQKKKYACAAK